MSGVTHTVVIDAAFKHNFSTTYRGMVTYPMQTKILYTTIHFVDAEGKDNWSVLDIDDNRMSGAAAADIIRHIELNMLEEVA